MPIRISYQWRAQGTYANLKSMSRLSSLRGVFAWVAILGMLLLPLAAATAMPSEHGSTTVIDLQGPVLTAFAPDTDPCCATHQSGQTDCGKFTCAGAASCMAKCVPGTAAPATKATGTAFGGVLVPYDEMTVALYGPEPPMEPPRA